MKVLDKVVYAFSKDIEANATVKSGEVVLFKTQDCFAGQFTSEEQLLHELDLNRSNPSTGPVFVEGAEVGDVIVVDILDIKVADKGFACSVPGVGPLGDKIEARTKLIPIENNFAKFKDVEWKIDPMIGVIGTAPAEGEIPCGFAGDHGGNMDSKLIKKGAKVYLPVRVEGGLVLIGDLHATMGDGELSGTGIEVAGEVLVKINLIKKFKLNWPVTETENNWYVNATGKDYDEALIAATTEMDRLMRDAYGWDISDNQIYFSLQGDVEINQAARPSDMDMFNLRFGIPKLNKKELVK